MITLSTYVFKTDFSDEFKFKDVVKSINFSTLIDSQHNADPDKNVEIILKTMVKIKNQHLPTKRIKIKKKHIKNHPG